QAVNAELQVLCDHTDNTTFISNDNTFILQDGTINEGFLNRDGLHLNPAGTNRLVHNMGLTKSLKSVTKPFNQYKKSRSNAPKNGPNTTPRPNSDSFANNMNNNLRARVTHNNANGQPIPKHSLANVTSAANKAKPICYKCGEASHLASTCWHPNSIRCYSCMNLGHKTHKCPYKDISTSNKY
ncbi:unnamed protein product, partial [Owenia fusiformis]